MSLIKTQDDFAVSLARFFYGLIILILISIGTEKISLGIAAMMFMDVLTLIYKRVRL